MNPNEYVQTGQLGLFGEELQGFRLQRLEAYNWGTFDEKIWSYEPKGQTTLLTGDSGSGKSTMVDALATLLVSPRKIAYNKAADASARERSLTSYVRGFYGQKYTYEGRGHPEALRDHRQYTVLLAVFADGARQKTVTLAVFLWFREPQGNPSRFYAVAQKELSIAGHFAGFRGDIRTLKNALRVTGAEVFDDYNHYAACYRKALGDLTQQAIDLFQQTISMKKVEALTDFVRSSMLEETDINSEIDKLLGHYTSLNSAYEAVQRARKQTQLLEPICREGREYSIQNDKLEKLRYGESAIEVWFAALKQPLFSAHVAELEQALEQAKSKTISEQAIFDKLESEITWLNREIYENGGGALEELSAELERLVQALEQKQKAQMRYGDYAKRLDLAAPQSRDSFVSNMKQAEARRQLLPEKLATADAQLSNVSARLENEKAAKKEIDEELESLKERTSNIPKSLITLRHRLCAALQISEESLPFVGELLEVMDSELAWEGAIERLLHSFALSLLVADEHYTAVSQWVNAQHLGARLVYFSTRPRPGAAPQLHPDAVATKLLVKQQTRFTPWLQRELAERFMHVCCSDIAVFRQEKHAITPTGQIKSATRHEKDDRRRLDDRSLYVLGFSNQKKIDTLTQRAAELAGRVASLQADRDTASTAMKDLEKQSNALFELSRFTDFSELDVQGAQRERTICEERISQLTQREGAVLDSLRDRLTKTKEKKEKQNGQVTNAKIHEHDIKNALKDGIQKQRENDDILQSETALERLAYPALEENRKQWLGSTALTLKNSESLKKNYHSKLRGEIDKISKAIETLSTGIVKGIMDFMHKFPMETREIDGTLDSLPELHRMYEQLVRDDLPRYEKDFKDRLTTQVLNQIAIFQMVLRQEYDKVRKRIESINGSMHSIDYNPSRYIKLNSAKAKR